MSRERWSYLLVVAALIVGAAAAVQLVLWQRMEVREAQLIEALSRAAREASGDSDAEFARVCTLAEGSCALIDQHVKSSEIVIALATLFFGGIAFATLSQIRQSTTEAAAAAVKPAVDELSAGLRRRFDLVDGALRRMVEYLASSSPARRQTALRMAGEIGVVEFMGVWREILCNSAAAADERQLAVAALVRFRGRPEAEEAAEVLAESCLAIYQTEAPQPEAVLRRAILGVQELGIASDAVSSALEQLVEHPSATVSQAASNARTQLGLM